ncbi:hypothetical protein JOD54_004310 [Actinokineospora baliensis]|uniref:DUF11 domain-containing protein n=1 Tax=Actinokineospora baliensis TaxID=547056 RepID=UPI00195A832F|nr:DUF11 domain-containing protein [Actinokineospora baliensis]MBM7774106.1 hypothetical protein [Actinokineospora baliensis]
MKRGLALLLGLLVVAGVFAAPASATSSAVGVLVCPEILPEHPHISSYNLKNLNRIDIKTSAGFTCASLGTEYVVTARITLERQTPSGGFQAVVVGKPVTKTVAGLPQTWFRGELFAVGPCLPGTYRGKIDIDSQALGQPTPKGYATRYSDPRPIDCLPKRTSMVIDDTGSMAGVIGSVSTSLSSYIAAQPEDEYTRWSLTTFKDSPTDVGTTDDRAEALGWVNALSASGGGDCPEDVLGGINSGMAALGGDPGVERQMIVATDASAQAGDVDGIIGSARAAGVRVNVLLTGDCGAMAARTAAGPMPSQVVLKRIADETGGRYYYLPGASDADLTTALGQIFAQIADPTPPNGPAAVEPVAGDGQSTAAGTRFPTPLTAAVTTASGQPTTGTAVTFTIDGTATFPDGTNTATVTTGSDGRATAPAITAGATVGAVTVSASTPGATSGSFSATITAAVPASITTTSGGGQSAPVGTAFPATLVATVTDTAGEPSAAIPVTFTISGPATFPGGSTTATVTTGADGQAVAPVLTAGPQIGTVTVRASTPGATPATFTEMVTAAVPATITATSGSGQSATAGTTFAAPLVATVTTTAATPAADVPVTFTVTSGAATFPGGSATATVNTGANGQAISPTLSAGSATGAVSITAAAAGLTTPAAFTATVTAPQGSAKADLAVSISAPTNASSGTPFTVRLTVRNNGPSTATLIYSGISLAKGLRITNPGGGTPTDNNRAVVFSHPGLANGATVTYTVTVTPDRNVTGPQNIVAASASIRVGDPNYRNNVATSRLTLRR